MMYDEYDIYTADGLAYESIDMFMANKLIKEGLKAEKVVMRCNGTKVSVNLKNGDILVNDRLVDLQLEKRPMHYELVNFNRLYETYAENEGHTSEIIYIIGWRGNDNSERLIAVKEDAIELWGEEGEILNLLK